MGAAVGDDGAEQVQRALDGSRAAQARLIETTASSIASRSGTADSILDDLALRAAGGNEKALELLLDLVHRLSLARAGVRAAISDDALAEDAAQAALMKVEQRISQFEGRARFRTWLYTVARNEALMAIRVNTPTPVEEVPEDTKPRPRLSSVIATRETIETLIGELPDPYSETLRLQLYEHLDYHQIAERQGVPVGTVRSRLARAKKLMSERLGT